MKHLNFKLFFESEEYIKSLVETLSKINIVIAFSRISVGNDTNYRLTIEDLSDQGTDMNDVIFNLGIIIGGHEIEHANTISVEDMESAVKSKTVLTTGPEDSCPKHCTDEDMGSTYQEFLDEKVENYLKKYRK